MALPTSSNKPKIEGLGTSDRKLSIAKPEHIKRGILILLGIATLLVVAAVWKGISNSRSFEARQEQKRADRAARDDAAANKAAEANTTNPADTFQADVATFKRNGVDTSQTATTTTGTTTAPADTTGPSAMSEKMQEAINEERLRAYKDMREPLALSVPNGDKPVGTTTSASVRQVSQPEPDAQQQAQQAPVDAETQALLQQRARLAEQLRLVEQSAAGGR